MRKYLSLPSKYKIGTNFYLNPNYEYNFHSTNERGQGFLAIRTSGSNPCFSTSTMRSNIKAQSQTSKIRSNNSLCSYKEISSYPYMKKRQNSDSNDSYRHLYLQLITKLDMEKKKNERMKYDKKVNVNNIKNWQKEKDIYQKINQLKNKQNEIPKIKKTYEQMINKLKEDANKKIDYLNNQLNSLSKENIELNYRLKKSSTDDLIKKLNKENNELKIELEKRDQIIEKIKKDNNELANLLEKLANKFHQDYTNSKYQNSKLNINEIKKLTDELNKLRKGNSLGNQTIYNFKSGNENKNNEISSLKKLLSQKDEEIDELNNEIERNFDLLGENRQLKKENEQNKIMIIKNTKNIKLLKQKLPKSEDNYKKLLEENEQIKQEKINLKEIKNKYKNFLEEKESFKKRNNKLKEENIKPKDDNKNINDLKNKYDSLIIDYKSILNEKNNLEKECNEMKKNIKNLLQEINSLKDKISELEKINDNSKREISELESKYAKEAKNLNTEITKINKTITEKDNKIEDYEKDLKNKDKTIKDLEKELDSAKNENDKLKSENKNISIEIIKITKTAEENEKTIKNLEKELKNLNNDYDKLNEENQKLNKMITEKEKIIKDLEKKIKDVCDEKDKFQIEIKTLNSEITKLNKQIKENNIKHLEIELENSNDNLSGKEKGIKGLEKELEKEDQLYDQSQKLSKDIKNLKTELTPLTTLIKKKDRNIKSLEKELNESNNQNSNLNNNDNHLSFGSLYSQDLSDSSYNIINLKDNDNSLKDEFENIVDKYFKELKNMRIDHKFIDNQKMNTDIFNYKILTYEYEEYKICRVNYWARNNFNMSEYINISPKILENIKTTNEIKIYYKSNNSSLIYYVLNLCFEKFSRSATKLRIYHIGLKYIDKVLFTLVASYLSKNPKIDTFCLCGRSLGQFKHLKDQLEDPTKDDRNEKMEREIYDMERILNLYQVLMKKTNLVELRLIIFLDRSNFCMLGAVLKNNTNLRILEVRNVISKDEDKEIDLGYFNPDNIHDEIFIFFNYLFAEENITELSLTHFIFSSDINFMAVQAAKTMKNLEILNLTSSYGLVKNDNFMINAYNLSFSPMTQLNMSETYFEKIRNWDSLINPLKLQFLDAGVCDFPSFTSLCRYLEYCHLEKVFVRLDKLVIIENIPALFNLISEGPMRSKYLKYFYVLKAFDKEVKEDPKFKNIYLPRLFNNMKNNKVLRKLSFAKPSKYYYEIKNDHEEDGGFKTFKYIKKKDYNSALFLMKAMKILFRSYNEYSKDEVNNLIKNVIIYRFSNYRKFITG